VRQNPPSVENDDENCTGVAAISKELFVCPNWVEQISLCTQTECQLGRLIDIHYDRIRNRIASNQLEATKVPKNGD